MLVAFLIGWTTVDVFGLTESGDNPIGHYFVPGGIAWIAIVVVGVLAVLGLVGALPDDRNWGRTLGIGAFLGAGLMVLQVAMGATTPEGFTELGVEDAITVTRGPGMYLGLIAAIVSAIGAALAMLDRPGHQPDT